MKKDHVKTEQILCSVLNNFAFSESTTFFTNTFSLPRDHRFVVKMLPSFPFPLLRLCWCLPISAFNQSWIEYLKPFIVLSALRNQQECEDTFSGSKVFETFGCFIRKQLNKNFFLRSQSYICVRRKAISYHIVASC